MLRLINHILASEYESECMAMIVNMGLVDRGLRFVIGVLLIAFAIPIGFAETGWNWVGWIGVVPILTALIGNCPAYSILGVSTCPAKQV
jgi:hypothetical protein